MLNNKKNNIEPRLLIFELCKLEFNCYSSSIDNCWCKDMPIVNIKDNLKDCVCFHCINKL